MTNDFKVGTFNLFNLISPEKTYYGKRSYSHETYQQKIAWIGSQLDRMGADIVGFQEVFDEKALREALQKSDYMRSAKIVMVPCKGDTPSVAIASRFPILAYEVIEGFPATMDMETKEFTRAILKVTIEVRPNLAITFLTAHLKSKRPMLDKEDRDITLLERSEGEVKATIHRLAEALALRTIIVDELQNRRKPLILVGDLNDNDRAVSTRVISGEPPFRNMPDHVKRGIWDIILYHVKEIQSRKSYQDFYYTHIHNGHHEALDHIMVSQELVAENPESIGRVGYVRTFNDHLIDETLSDERVAEWQSDHAQVVACIELKG
ncbi:MAG: endonuclease/exonuclease/phosphatase family protein [Bacteroidetes bacterium]|nr:MAG: endonuclease/exonuclease/phosphatase family protein [Bacteroidota bacterium]